MLSLTLGWRGDCRSLRRSWPTCVRATIIIIIIIHYTAIRRLFHKKKKKKNRHHRPVWVAIAAYYNLLWCYYRKLNIIINTWEPHVRVWNNDRDEWDRRSIGLWLAYIFVRKPPVRVVFCDGNVPGNTNKIIFLIGFQENGFFDLAWSDP